MKKIVNVITTIAIIAAVPFYLMLLFFWMIKAYFRYKSDKDKEFSYYFYLTDVRHDSWVFNRAWRKMRSKGIYID